jgi:hypothetical protein
MAFSPHDAYGAYVFGTSLLRAAQKLNRPGLKDSALVYLEIAAPRLPRETELQQLVQRLKSEAR